MLATFYEMAKASFHLIGTDCYYVKVEWTIYCCRHTLSSQRKSSGHRLADYVKKKALKSVPHVQNVHFSWFNQLISLIYGVADASVGSLHEEDYMSTNHLTI